MPEIRGSDVWVKADMAGFLMALQQTAARFPPGEFHEGYLAAIASFRAMLGIPVALADCDALTERPAPESVRVLPPAPAPAITQRPPAHAIGADGRRFAARALAVEDWDGAPVMVDAGPAALPAPALPAVADSARVVEIERGADPVVVRPDVWRLVAHGDSFVYDEIAGPGRYVLPADRWVPVPVSWRHRVGVELVPDQWALFVTVDWAIRHLGRERVRVAGGRAQITG